MIKNYFLNIVISFVFTLIHSAYAFAQIEPTSNSITASQLSKNILTPEEVEWVKNHPVIRSTIKNGIAPNEFLRAGEPAGFSVGYLNLVAENVGLEIEYVSGNSWIELIDQLKERNIDISHNIFHTDEREEFLNFTKPYIDLQLALFARKGSEQIVNWQQLEGKTIGVVKGWGPASSYKKLHPELSFVELDSSLDALVSLSLSTAPVDIYVLPRLVGNSILTKNFISNVDMVGYLDALDYPNNKQTRIAARNDWPELITILEKGMAAITDQQYSALTEQWIVTDQYDDISTLLQLNLTPDEQQWLSQNQVIKVAVDPSFPPIEFINSENQISGIAGSYLEIVAQKLNIRFEWVRNRDFKDGISKIISKEADMLSAVNPTFDRQKYLNFTDSYMNVNTVIFAREGEQVFGDLDGLKGHRIAQVKGFVSTEWIKRDYPEIEIIEAPSIAEALKLVSGGVVDAHLGSVPVTAHNIAAEGLTNLVVAGVTPYSGNITMGIRSEMPHLSSAIQKALDSIDDSERTAINQKWIALKAPTKNNYELVWQIMLAAFLIVILILIWNYRLRQEVTQRKFSEERFRQIAETIDGVFFICNPRTLQVQYVSPNIEKWSDATRQELYENPEIWLDYIHPDDLSIFTESLKNFLASNFSISLPDYRILYQDKPIRWLSTETYPVRDDNGELKSIIGLMTDITSNVKSETKLSEINNQFENAFTHASHGMALVSLEGRFLKVNEALCNILGYSQEELCGLDIEKITFTDDIDTGISLMNEILAGKRLSYQMEKHYQHKNGKIVPTQVNSSLVRDKNGTPIHFVKQIQDISAHKEREELLRHSQKMDAVGQITGGIAHDFNNILGIILGNLEILKNTPQNAPKSKMRLEKAINGVERGTHLIKKLLSFSRKNSQKSELIIINDCISNLMDFITRSLTVSIEVKASLANDLWPVEVDAGDLEDAILNLALNARDAIRGSGKIFIKTENIILDSTYAEFDPGCEPGEYVMLTIRDTGSGIAPELFDKVLEPFFTTKSANKGTGLGLSMVHGFVHRSKGQIKIHSELKKGTEIRIYLPRSYLSDEITRNTITVPKTLPCGNETILVVDDEQHLCDVAKTQLKNLGYSVYTSNNPSMALEMLQDNRNIDLLFSDIVMPDNMDGYEMANSALKLNPSLKVLLTSGFTQNLETNRNGKNKTISQLKQNMLQKPYNQFELAVAVRNSLDI